MQEPPIYDPRGTADPDAPVPDQPTRRANFFTWLIDLYFRPGRALAGRVRAMPRPSLFMLTWMIGVAAAIGQFSLRMEMGSSSPVTLDWVGLWSIAIIGGLLGGLVRLLIWGAWYHCRVWLSGGRNFTWSQSRRVYAAASLVWVLPELLSWCVYAALYDTPQEAVDDVLWVLVLPGMLVPFWAIWTGYRGARTALGARRGPALFWLLGLPWAFVLLVVIGFAAMTMHLGETPDIDNPESLDNPAIRFNYPGNWRATLEEDAWVSTWAVEVADPYDTLYANISMYYDDLTPQERLDELLADIRNAGWTMRSQTPLAEWGRLAGAGTELTASKDGEQFQVRLLAFEIEPGVLGDIYTWVYSSEANTLHTGLDLIAESLQFIPTARQQTDLANTTAWHNRFFTIDVPGNWFREPVAEEDGWGPGLESTSPQGSWQSINCYETDASPMEEILESIEHFAANADDIEFLESPETYAIYPCVGQVIAGRTEEGAFSVSVYAIPIDDHRVIEIINFTMDTHRPFVDPGFTHLEQTFRLVEGITINDAMLLPSAQGETKPQRSKPEF